MSEWLWRRGRDLQFWLGLKRQKWPTIIDVWRHGFSEANEAREKAEREGRADIGLGKRDADARLTTIGHDQARHAGLWYLTRPMCERPTVAISSPYPRAGETGDDILQFAGIDKKKIHFVVDERLREKEFGILEGLTKAAIRTLYPEEWKRRQSLGKFDYRPPGGESWNDVILRLRSLNEMIIREFPGEVVALFTHSATINCQKYLLERLAIAQALENDRLREIGNCSLNRYRFDRYLGRSGKLVLELNSFLPPGVIDTNPKDMPEPIIKP